VTSIVVSCTDRPFTIGGSISGLGSNTGLVLANGTDSLPVPAGATTFTLTAVPFGSLYAVTVQSSPAGLLCTVTNGSGTVPAGNVTNVAVICSDQSYSLGGTITGLTTAGLLLGNGTDTVTVAAGASTFTFHTAVAFGSSYAAMVQTQPTGLTCSVSNGTGTMPAGAVTSISIACSPLTYTVGGTISGLGSASGLVLASGGDAVTVLANAAAFTLPSGIAYGSTYDVVVHTQPSGLNCVVTNGSGTVTANVSNISVSCTPSSVTVTIPGAPAPVVLFLGACVSQSTSSYTYTCLASTAAISSAFDVVSGLVSFELTGTSASPTLTAGGSCAAGFNPTLGTFTVATPSFNSTDTISLAGSYVAEVTYTSSYLASLGLAAGLNASALIIVDSSNPNHFQVLETSSITAGAVAVTQLFAEGGSFTFGSTGVASLRSFACQAL
jgi:hypothetical protein